MVKKSTKRLVYVLSPSGSSSGHSLGVNSLAIDPRRTDTSSGCLYTAGRDGIIHSWDLHGDDKTTPGSKVQIHTNWVNDIVLTHDYNKGKSCVCCYISHPCFWVAKQPKQDIILSLQMGSLITKCYRLGFRFWPKTG